MWPPHCLTTISSAIFISIFTHFSAGREEALCRSLSECTEIKCKDIKSTTALGQSWEVANLLLQHFLILSQLQSPTGSTCRVRNKNGILWEWRQHTEWAGRAPNHLQNHNILVMLLFFLAALEYDVEMREVALRTPDHLHLHCHTVLCVITNNPVTFFSESLLKKLNNRVYTKTFCMCFPKFHFWEKFHSHRDDKKQRYFTFLKHLSSKIKELHQQ